MITKANIYYNTENTLKRGKEYILINMKNTLHKSPIKYYMRRYDISKTYINLSSCYSEFLGSRPCNVFSDANINAAMFGVTSNKISRRPQCKYHTL